MIVFPPCKVNLGLHVTEKRPDGFHSINTCFYPVPWTDILEAVPADDFYFEVTGLNIPGSSEENICTRAYMLLQNHTEVPGVRLHLHKIIPMGAGLGGGSSDGAHTLKLLNDLFKLGFSKEMLKTFAIQLGSDCAFFLEDGPMFGSGRGEILQPAPIDLKGKFLVVVCPDEHISTREAFQEIKPVMPKNSINEILLLPSSRWREELSNDFEPAVFTKHPKIAAIKEKLYSYGAIYASLSGSGAAVFGIFDQPFDTHSVFKDTLHWRGLL